MSLTVIALKIENTRLFNYYLDIVMRTTKGYPDVVMRTNASKAGWGAIPWIFVQRDGL